MEGILLDLGSPAAETRNEQGDVVPAVPPVKGPGRRSFYTLPATLQEEDDPFGLLVGRTNNNEIIGCKNVPECNTGVLVQIDSSRSSGNPSLSSLESHVTSLIHQEQSAATNGSRTSIHQSVTSVGSNSSGTKQLFGNLSKISHPAQTPGWGYQSDEVFSAEDSTFDRVPDWDRIMNEAQCLALTINSEEKPLKTPFQKVVNVGGGVFSPCSEGLYSPLLDISNITPENFLVPTSPDKSPVKQLLAMGSPATETTSNPGEDESSGTIFMDSSLKDISNKQENTRKSLGETPRKRSPRRTKPGLRTIEENIESKENAGQLSGKQPARATAHRPAAYVGKSLVLKRPTATKRETGAPVKGSRQKSEQGPAGSRSSSGSLTSPKGPGGPVSSGTKQTPIRTTPARSVSAGSSRHSSSTTSATSPSSFNQGKLRTPLGPTSLSGGVRGKATAPASKTDSSNHATVGNLPQMKGSLAARGITPLARKLAANTPATGYKGIGSTSKRSNVSSSVKPSGLSAVKVDRSTPAVRPLKPASKVGLSSQFAGMSVSSAKQQTAVNTSRSVNTSISGNSGRAANTSISGISARAANTSISGNSGRTSSGSSGLKYSRGVGSAAQTSSSGVQPPTRPVIQRQGSGLARPVLNSSKLVTPSSSSLRLPTPSSSRIAAPPPPGRCRTTPNSKLATPKTKNSSGSYSLPSPQPSESRGSLVCSTPAVPRPAMVRSGLPSPIVVKRRVI